MSVLGPISGSPMLVCISPTKKSRGKRRENTAGPSTVIWPLLRVKMPSNFSLPTSTT
ncbi:hypothetical protein SK128_010281, partial [Halocaridina rubra]